MHYRLIIISYRRRKSYTFLRSSIGRFGNNVTTRDCRPEDAELVLILRGKAVIISLASSIYHKKGHIMLELKNCSFRVEDTQGRSDIVKDVSFTVDDGKFVVITGQNGGGKSTIARLIMGIEQPTSGSILFGGQDITHMSVTERARLGIGYAFQQPPRFKGLTVRRLLSLAHGSDLPEDECCSYLTSVGLCSKDYLNREVDSSLSGGELKRIEIATLMARELSLAIYDEPEAGIDLWSFAMLVNSFRAMSKNRHRSVILISHQERIMSLADEIIVLNGGEITRMGPRDEVFSDIICQLNDSCDFGGGARA